MAAGLLGFGFTATTAGQAKLARPWVVLAHAATTTALAAAYTHRTRLDMGRLLRDRMVWAWWQLPFRLLVFEPLHAYMETGVLQGIKARVEATPR